jgi:integrase/recombinase XerD
VPKPRPPADLSVLLPSFELTLRAERKSPSTIKSYGNGVRRFLAWCGENDVKPELTRASVNAFVAAVLDQGAQATTAKTHQLGIRRFSAWLTEEGEYPADPLMGIKPPKLDLKVIEPLSEGQLKALLKACAGSDFRAHRDTALVRFMVETGTRAGEVVALEMTDVDRTAGTAIVRRGKGGKGRLVPFGSQTAQALDRYIRTRRMHKLADSPPLWLGDRNRGFTYNGLHFALGNRAKVAGIPNFHPHLLRHTAAHRWLAAGGSEGGLMSVAGWSQPDMLMRYTKARASDRAAAEARTLNLGDL